MKVILGHFHFSYHFNTAYDSIIDMPTCFSSPVRHSPQNSPFIHDQGSWVILKFGELKYPWAMSAGCSCWISSWRIQEMFPSSKRSSGSFGTSKRPGQHDPSPLGVGIVDGRCLAFEGPVTGGMYLEMLMTVMWPSVRAQAARRGYWFQQDGVPVHVTFEVMDFLRSKFGGRSCSPGELSTIGHPTVRICPAWTSVSGPKHLQKSRSECRRPSMNEGHRRRLRPQDGRRPTEAHGAAHPAPGRALLLGGGGHFEHFL